MDEHASLTVLRMDSHELELQRTVLAIIARAVAKRSGDLFEVCVRAPNDQELIHFGLGSFAEVRALAAQLRDLGYDLTMMHPKHTSCDFVLESHAAGAA
jgi:hypothetical protein